MKQLLLFLLMSYSALAQKPVTTTQSFTVSGDVKIEKTISISEFIQWKEHTIGDVTITNHLGEVKGVARAMKGVLLKDVLQSVELKAESPKVFSEWYIVCRATDGYKVVYSWNEIFNSKIGESIYLVTEKEGKRGMNMTESILMISTEDYKTGRRFVKSLAFIEFRRAN
ncbi:MAG: molybdopterin-binding protein [Cyclobacteriaceae bacterium]|nr:molybdopterin-binding protein [Cyclobacteriaceae bacterium]